MKRGGVTDPKVVARDEARENLQMLVDSKQYMERKLEEIREKREKMMDDLYEARNDPTTYAQHRTEDDKLRDEFDRTAIILENLRARIAEQEAIANPPAIGRPPWETGAGRKKKTRKNVIGPLKKGELTSLGYSSSKKAKTRRQALEKAVDRYGPLSTLRKVNAIRVLTKRRAPKVSKTLKADVKYLQKHYFSS